LRGKAIAMGEAQSELPTKKVVHHFHSQSRKLLLGTNITLVLVADQRNGFKFGIVDGKVADSDLKLTLQYASNHPIV